MLTELSSLLPIASPAASRLGGCKAPGTAPGGSGAAQVGASRAGSHCHYHTAIKPSSVKCLGSSKLAPSDGKMCLEALQPCLFQGVTDNPAASQIPCALLLPPTVEGPSRSHPLPAFQSLPFLKRNSCAARRFYHFVLRIS